MRRIRDDARSRGGRGPGGPGIGEGSCAVGGERDGIRFAPPREGASRWRSDGVCECGAPGGAGQRPAIVVGAMRIEAWTRQTIVLCIMVWRTPRACEGVALEGWRRWLYGCTLHARARWCRSCTAAARDGMAVADRALSRRAMCVRRAPERSFGNWHNTMGMAGLKIGSALSRLGRVIEATGLNCQLTRGRNSCSADSAHWSPVRCGPHTAVLRAPACGV